MSEKELGMYQYKAQLLKVVDGDTVDLTVDVGFYMRFDGRFRLAGVDTPERGQPGYDRAKEWLLQELLAEELTIYSEKSPDKYGRWLVRIFVGDNLVSVNSQLIDLGMAVPYDGGTKPKAQE